MIVQALNLHSFVSVARDGMTFRFRVFFNLIDILSTKKKSRENRGSFFYLFRSGSYF